MSTASSSSLSYLRPEVAALKKALDAFVEHECIPCEVEYHEHMETRHGPDRWTPDAIPPCIGRLQQRAQELGLWNLFLPRHLLPAVQKLGDPSLLPSVSLTFREYGILCESMGRSPLLAPEACNCSAPDTGNMEVLLEFGTRAQQQQYAVPLLRGQTRSAFLMTEPAVASSDATNLQTELRKLPASDTTTTRYVLNGRKWWSTGAMDPRCAFFLVVARMQYEDTTTTNSSTKHGAHTIVLVPRTAPGITLERALTVLGYDDAPHGHAQVRLDTVQLTADKHLIQAEGSGFRVAQARLGPGRVHHCMRAVGTAARALELMVQRTRERHTFGTVFYAHGAVQEAMADSVADLHAARLLTLACAQALDEEPRHPETRSLIATIKVRVPQLTYQVVDRAVQVFGGAGMDHPFLARALVGLRSLRIADGPDAVHKRSVARMEIRRAQSRL